MNATLMAKGILSWIPGVPRTLLNRNAAHGAESAAYCYGVWIKHLALCHAAGMRSVPRTLLELGPGATLGTGVAGLLSGAESYLGLDAIAHSQPGAALGVFEQITGFLRERAPRPRPGFPPIDGHLDKRLFPSAILHDAALDRALAPPRLTRIDAAIRALDEGAPDSMLRYHTWDENKPVDPGSIDMLFSHVVLSQVRDLELVYDFCGRVVARGGWMSHQIDFTSLDITPSWNGHLAYGDVAWKVALGARPYFMNRQPLGRHLALAEANGFEVMQAIRGYRHDGLRREQLAPRFRAISDEDLVTTTAFVVCRKK